jgi:hypothetical protein
LWAYCPVTSVARAGQHNGYGEMAFVKSTPPNRSSRRVRGMVISDDAILSPERPTGQVSPAAADAYHASLTAYEKAFALAWEARRLESRAHTALRHAAA